jgi:hypothetical protein
MQTGWLKSAGVWTVEHVPCPDYAGDVDVSTPAKGVQHTTEGSTIEGALAVFRQHYAPHFLVGRDAKNKVRILQLLPLGRAAAALEHPPGTVPTNGYARVQIELVGFSQHKLWCPDKDVTRALGCLYGALAQMAGIPLVHVSNPQRDPKVWAKGSGWFGHDGVPANAHWDPGVLDYATVFSYSGRAVVPPAVRRRPRRLVLHPLTYTLVRRANGLVYAEQLDRPH